MLNKRVHLTTNVVSRKNLAVSYIQMTTGRSGLYAAALPDCNGDRGGKGEARKSGFSVSCSHFISVWFQGQFLRKRPTFFLDVMVRVDPSQLDTAHSLL